MRHIFLMQQVMTVFLLGANVAVGNGMVPDGFRVSLLGPTKVIQGEPVLLTLRVENTSQLSRYIVVPEIRRFGPKTVLFRLATANAATFEDIQYPDIYIGGMKNLPPKPLPVQCLQSGMTAEFNFTLMYDFPVVTKRKRLFDRPGTYTVEVTIFEPKSVPQDRLDIPYDAEKNPITPEPFSFEIIPPENAMDKMALARLIELPDEYLLYAPETFRSDCHAEAIMKIAEMFRDFSQTRYGRYCALPLGVALNTMSIDIDRKKIETILESAGQEKDFPLHREAMIVLEKMRRSKSN
ncbi:MAG: hypothetical protein L6455_05255 [Kiritimatiellae bacterium]|nr:hypothetical protein [Kiritimatiellia bacterium]